MTCIPDQPARSTGPTNRTDISAQIDYDTTPRRTRILIRGQLKGMAIPFLVCMVAAASFYNLPPRVLPSIQVVEGGRPGTISWNTDGSSDLGVMQVNTRWVPRFAEITGMTHEAVRTRLIADPCFNIAAAGAIMRLCLNESRGDLLRAVGFYHSHTPVRADEYQAKVLVAATTLFVRQTQLPGRSRFDGFRRPAVDRQTATGSG
jgi:Transglycosylase SLT domain